MQDRTQVDPSIKTLTGIPNFPAYVSGHSTFSGAAATILGYLVPENAAKYTAMAEEAGLSRLVGGIHYRTDCEAGLSVGNKVGDMPYCVRKTTELIKIFICFKQLRPFDSSRGLYKA